MDILLLSRIQFGITVGLHYLFPVTTLGLTFFIMIFESLYLVKKSPSHHAISIFLVKLLGIVFTAGVATGLMLPLAFGANWARFTAFAGAFFGSAVAIEAMTAFAFESGFLAILVFGRGRVSPRVYWFSALCVFLGAHLSAFLIVAANSWMQTPAGFTIENGHVVVTNFLGAIFNPSTLIRFAHVVVAAWLAGSIIVSGIAAFFALRNTHEIFVKIVFGISMPLMLILALLQPVLGHVHIMNVLKFNPEKDAAYEGIFYSVNGAPLYSFGIPDEKNKTIHFAIGMPYGLSVLESGNPFSKVKGLSEYPRENWPPVNVIFTTFHLMVMLGMLMIAAGAIGVFLLWKKKLLSSRWYMLVLPWLIPLPYCANELGWIGAEIGRQPWTIHGVMKTADAVSLGLVPWQVATSLFVIVFVYLLLIAATLYFVFKQIKTGPTL